MSSRIEDLSSGQDVLASEIARRRTFAIISHPDAGKTTLTEKLLLYGGAIDMAGAVRARKGQRHATSDWMAMEQSRGISITSTALQFEYGGCYIDSRVLLKDVWDLVRSINGDYAFYKLFPEGPRRVNAYEQRFETFQYSNWAVVRRDWMDRV